MMYLKHIFSNLSLLFNFKCIEKWFIMKFITPIYSFSNTLKIEAFLSHKIMYTYIANIYRNFYKEVHSKNIFKHVSARLVDRITRKI